MLVMTGSVPFCPPTPADEPSLLTFTSGTNGKPKGVVHSQCDFPVKAALDLSICMDLKRCRRPTRRWPSAT